MDKEVTILIADRNPNIRKLLKREMNAEHYRVIVAEDARTLLKIASEAHTADILIIDPDLPDMETSDMIEKLNRRIPPLPIIIHALPEENFDVHCITSGIFIEKGSRSIEVIKRSIREMITEHTK